MKIADQYVEGISEDELDSTMRSFEKDGYRDVYWVACEAHGEGVHVSWYGSRPPCTCELYGECARCEPQRAAGRYLA